MKAWWSGVLVVIILLAVAALACDFSGKPTVTLTFPPSNFEINEGEELGVEVSAKGGGNIDRVELWVDDRLVSTAANPSPQGLFNARLIWVASGLGSHTLQVRAYNAAGVGSAPVAVVVMVEEGVAVATATSEIGPFATETPTTAPATMTPTNTVAPPTPTPTATVTPSPPPTCPGAPVIPSFYADPSTITAGGSSTLHWDLVTNASSASIDQGIGGVGTPGSIVVSPATTTTYTMTATGCGGMATKQATIIVNPAGPTVLLDFVAAAPSARWYVGTCPGGGACNYIEDVPWCGPADAHGSACYADSIQLEDGSVPARVLATHPRWEDQGHIAAEYPNLVTIQAGDRFKAKVGFAFGAIGSDGVTFRIIWAEAADGWLSHVIQEVPDTYDGSLKTFDVDLSSIAGKTVKFRLHVKAGPSSGQDWAIWLNPRVERP